MTKTRISAALAALLAAAPACAQTSSIQSPNIAAPANSFTLTSPDLTEGQGVPQANLYNGQGGRLCTGGNHPPRLSWTTPPAATAQLALEMIDTTVSFLHWRLPGLPASWRDFPPPSGQAIPPALINDFGHRSYDGPCPPPGPAHRYVFRVIALDAPYPPSLDPADAAAWLTTHKLASATLTTHYP